MNRMIYRTPLLSPKDERALDAINGLRDNLRLYVRNPRRWYGTLRRATLARAVQGSNSIEGYHATVEDVAAVIANEEPSKLDPATRDAVAGYRDAMTYVIQQAREAPTIDASTLRAMHFMITRHDLSNNPGLWRPGPVWVNDHEGRAVYEAPERSLIEPLVSALLDRINASDQHVIVTGAMAHLNLVLVHPFSDGNGRVARCLQSLVLGSDGLLSPEFFSIEEYLGRNTPAYYAALNNVAGGRWSPDRSARPWIEFCITAHYRQAMTVRRRIREMEELWDRCEQLAAQHRLPGRTVAALVDSARGWRLRRSLYMSLIEISYGETVSSAVATRDLTAMKRAGLLDARGERRGRYYVGATPLRDAWHGIRRARPPRGADDPYQLPTTPTLPGLT